MLLLTLELALTLTTPFVRLSVTWSPFWPVMPRNAPWAEEKKTSCCLYSNVSGWLICWARTPRSYNELYLAVTAVDRRPVRLELLSWLSVWNLSKLHLTTKELKIVRKNFGMSLSRGDHSLYLVVGFKPLYLWKSILSLRFAGFLLQYGKVWMSYWFMN